MSKRDPAFDAAVQLHMKALMRFALNLCRDHTYAEDLVQSTVLKALEKHHHYESGTNLKAWLHTILRNDFLTNARKKSREIEDVDGVMSGMLSVPESQSWSADLRTVRLRMKRMAVDFRQAFELVCILGHEYETVAEMMGVPIGTIKSRVSRARDFIESGEPMNDEPEEQPAPVDGELLQLDRIVDLYKSGKSVSEISEELGGLKKSKIMAILASKNVKR